MRQCINLSLFVNKHFAKRVRFVINSSRQRDFLYTILRNLASKFRYVHCYFTIYYHFLRIAIELFLLLTVAALRVYFLCFNQLYTLSKSGNLLSHKSTGSGSFENGG